jgi:mRNA interferase MazF
LISITTTTMPNYPAKSDIGRGDVVLIPFPNSDLKTTKLRPAIIVQSDDLRTGLSQTVLAMISNLSRTGHPSRVLIRTAAIEGKESGLLLDSVIMTDNLATISTSEIIRVIGTLTAMVQVDEALRHTLKL